MAINDDDLELDDDSEQEVKPSNLKKIIIFATAGVLILVLTVGATLYFTGVIGGDEASVDADEQAATEPEEAKKDSDEEVSSETIYHKFKPAFVVNFEDKGKLRFLQVDLSVATKKPSIVDELTKHEPVIRNNLVLLYSSKSASELNSIEGKEELRRQTRETIQRVMQENVGNPGIDEVFFTGFVVQ